MSSCTVVSSCTVESNPEFQVDSRDINDAIITAGSAEAGDAGGASAGDSGGSTAGSSMSMSRERCDGLDNDDDGQVDEELEVPCLALIGVFEAPAAVSRLGAELTSVPDLDGDGHDDVIARGRRNARVRLIAISAQGEELWAINGDGAAGLTIAGGMFLGNGNPHVIISDPDNERMVVCDKNGQTTNTWPELGGEVTALARVSTPERDLLMLGVPLSADERGDETRESEARGLIKLLSFETPMSFRTPTVIYERAGAPDERRGERLFNVGDLDGDEVDDVVFTRSIYLERGEDVGTALVSGDEGLEVEGSLIASEDATYGSFASDLARGRFSDTGSLGFFFSAPLVSVDQPEQGALYSLLERDGEFSSGTPLYGQDASAQLGLSLATWSRPERDADLLLVGASDAVGLLDPLTGEYREITGELEGLAQRDASLSVGSGVVTSSAPGPDGTLRVWIGGASEEGGESMIWVYSAR